MFKGLPFALAAAVLLASTGFGAAQAPVAVPVPVPVPMTYNQSRAMNHFLNSPYTYRTYSGTTPGFYYEVATPYGIERVSRGFGYARLRITPWGYDGFEYAPPTRIETEPAEVVTYPAPVLVPFVPMTPAR